MSGRGQAFPTMVPQAAYETPLTPSAAPGSILTKGQRAYVIQTSFFFLMHISLKQMFLLLPCDLVINSPKTPVILSSRPSAKTDSSLKWISVFTTIQEGIKLSYRIKVNIYFMRPEVSVTWLLPTYNDMNPKGWHGLSATAAYIYVVRHFIKRRGGKGGEQCSMTDQSGDRDYVIHGSLAFLSVCQKAVRLKKVCSTYFSTLH